MLSDDDWDPDGVADDDVHRSRNILAGANDGNEGDEGRSASHSVDGERGSSRRDDDAHGDGSQRPREFHDGGGSTEGRSRRRRRPSSPSTSFSHGSSSRQQDDALSRHSANLSVAELSRMEETLLSQSSHHEEEEERQRRKLERKAMRDSGIKAKRTVLPPTEIQIKRREGYARFKYLKTTDLRDERDVGGSMECLMRKKLGERSERRRLELVARVREGAEKTMEDAEGGNDAWMPKTDLGIKSTDDHDGANWNFLDEGYTTMPAGDAAKLPYYVYGNSRRRNRAVPEIDVTSKSSSGVNHDADAGHPEKRQKTGHLMLPEQSTVTSGGIVGKKGPRDTMAKLASHLTPITQVYDDCVPRSFPLHFNRLKKRMDLHGMIDTVTPGSERMVLAHGRNANRLWIRMVASGVMAKDFDDTRALETDLNRSNVKNEDDSVSIVSSSFSSKSSVHSYQPLGVFSQMSHGNTSVIAMENVDNKSTTSVDNVKTTPLFRLMSMVHSLPKFTHRHQFLIKVAQEFGANRRLWENELRYLVECGDRSGEGCGNTNSEEKERVNLTERRAIKSFLGVDGIITSPPGWTSDPSMPTHPTVLKQRVHNLRSLILKLLRRRLQERKKVATTSPTGDLVETLSSLKEGISGGLMLEHTESEEAMSNIEIEEGNEDTQDEVPTITSKSELAGDRGRKPARAARIIHDIMNGSTDETTNCVGVRKEPPSAREGEEDDPTATLDESRVLMVSLIDNIQKPDPGAVDKYAKIIHESHIETSHIDVALASLIDHLTSSMARLRQVQQLNSSDFQHRRALKLLKEEIGFWHESIESYLNLAISLGEVPDVNLYKSRIYFPESAARAKAIMATQSYLANGGGVGCSRKGRKSKLSSWEVKEENNSSDDSDASDVDNNFLEMTVPSRNIPAYLETEELNSIKLAAVEIAKRGKDRDRKATSFTPIHLTTGIAMIVENLTPRAAELVSRQHCPDSSENRTPFDLMRNMLTLVEEEGSLISPPQSAWEARGNIIDDTLVKVMLEAAMMFRSCIIKGPENVDHWSWYVATLLSMLCVAFGTSESDHPGRQQLECFPRIRSCAAVAVHDFVSFAKNHDCAMFHVAVSSMLEWTNPIFLLHRPQQLYGSKVGFGSEVNYLHAYHVSEYVVTLWYFTRIGLVE
jgi:hypothetical protein